MQSTPLLYNSLSRKKEEFKPLNPPYVGIYVCGPTVYGDAHLGHARPYITFDVVYRYLTHLGYKVRYVRNITDVGHLENDADEGEDKIAKKARIEELEPMEVVKHYTDRFHQNMHQLNNLRPNIEPTASGHIIEQIEMIKAILDNGYAYEVNGSIYFDVSKYAEDNNYGKLSGRKTEDLLSNTRELTGQEDKKSPLDFALWKKASKEHIMRWPSPWSEGFPGWHLECSVMSTKYLGEHFDIHGGGMDLLFPHHECEIAQSQGSYKKDPCKYWMHNNMITINGQKMGKSLGNFITLNDLFSGENDVLDQPYSPMAVRFFVLQAHYRSTLDFSNEALQAAEKGYQKLMTAVETLNTLKPGTKSTVNVDEIKQKCQQAINDDFNTPIVIAQLFEGVKFINAIKAGNESVNEKDLRVLKELFQTYVFDVLGLKKPDIYSNKADELSDKLMDTIIELRAAAKENKNYELADSIRDKLSALNVVLKDSPEGTTWEYNA